MKPPERGDLIWLDFHPQSGREQAGRRPALVLSSVIYNRPTGLAIVCPVTSQGNVAAQLSLGSAYEQGQGVPRDFVEAYKWYGVAAANPRHLQINPKAAQKLAQDLAQDQARLAPSMSQNQITEARRLILVFTPTLENPAVERDGRRGR